MASDSGRDRAVAYLVFNHMDNANGEGVFRIQANAEFDIGRDQVDSILGVNDGTISKHHLRFHCVTYGENNIALIEPMVYVRTLSRYSVRLSQTAPDGSNSTCFLHQGHSPILLNHGGILQLSAKVSVSYEALPDGGGERRRLGSVAEAAAKCFEDQYTVVPRVLGVGGFASVFLAINTKSRRQVACKVVPLPKKPPVPGLSEWTSQKGRQAPAREAVGHIVRHRKKCQDLRREFEVLKGIDHPNIIRLEKAIYATDHIFIFQELVSGGDLLSYLERRGGLDEHEAAVMIYQLLKALEYLHIRGIVHRDIKPENILLTSWRRGARIVLTDFGQARKLVEDGNTDIDSRTTSRMRSLVGTHGYAAPEVYMRPDDEVGSRPSGYNEAVDVWLVGCLAGTLLTNAFLFPREQSGELRNSSHENITDLTVAFSLKFLDTSQDWQGASDRCKSFIRACAMVDDSQRLTVAQALQHPWVAHPGFKAEMDAEYARATADWTPRANSIDLIEYLKAPLPTPKAPKAGYEARLHQEVRSHHFQSPMSPTLSQFRTFNSSASTSGSHGTRLFPIESQHVQSNKPASNVDTAASSTGTNQFTQAKTHKHGEDEEASYLSIQNYAPPVMYPMSVVDTQDDLHHIGWGAQLAEPADLTGQYTS